MIEEYFDEKGDFRTREVPEIDPDSVQEVDPVGDWEDARLAFEGLDEDEDEDED